MLRQQIHLTLPPWIGDVVDTHKRYDTDEERVALAIELSRLNIERSHGGPFGAAVFDGQGRVVSVGVNRVVPQTCSIALIVDAECSALNEEMQVTLRLRCGR